MKKFGLGTDYSNSHYADKHWIQIFSEYDYPAISFRHICKEDSGKQKVISEKIEGFLDWFFIVLCSIFLFFRRPTLSSYFIPYALCFWAILLGVARAL